MSPALRRLASAALCVAFAGGAALAGCARVTRAPSRPVPRPTPRPTATPQPEPPIATPTPAPALPAASEPVPPLVPTPAERKRPVLPALVRIGLATDLESVTLPCCDGEVTALAGGEALEVVSPVTVRPASRTAGAASFRLQLAALRDDEQAAELARRVAAASGLAADARFDAQSGLYRVRAGRWPSREAAEAAGRGLARHGVDAFWVVSEGDGLTDPALEIVQRGRSRRVEGRRFALAAPPGGGLRAEGRRYRGRLVVFLNDRGRLNLVNELPLEEYLRGVVPRELGPGAYPELAALKAQAVAARTYTLRNLGEFADEGYDLCGTPRCQVYGGMEDEHPLSDRAVAETAGEVLLWRGEPIDALYSATCGGHTENVEVVFPLKTGPYLRGVPCVEAGVQTLAGPPAARGVEFPAAVTRRAMPAIPATIATAGDLETALQTIAKTAGFAMAPDRLAALDRREVFRHLATAYALALDARLFVQSEELDYLVAEPPADWTGEEIRFAAWIAKSGLLRPPAPAAAFAPGEIEELVFQLALRFAVIEERRLAFSSLRPGVLVARDGEADVELALAPDALTFRSEGGAPRPGPLGLVPSDGLRVYRAGERIVALVQEVYPGGNVFDREHRLSSWSRFRSDAELAANVNLRFPGFRFAGFEVLTRGVSGRAGAIRLRDTAGQTLDVAGLAVRWTLDLPDTLFTVRRLQPARGPAGWQFEGRGWGHGVGLCQTGAYGMSRRGRDYQAILAHYYRGAVLARLEPAP